MTDRRYKKFILAAILCLFASAATAQAPQTPQTPQPPRAGDGQAGEKLPVAAPVVADAPNARLAALVRRDVRLIRNKGVASVQRIRVGVYCITPTAASGIVPNRAIVMLTPEYYYSLLNEIKVQWGSGQTGCGANRIAVYTLADIYATGVYQFSNAVSFSIVVP